MTASAEAGILATTRPPHNWTSARTAQAHQVREARRLRAIAERARASAIAAGVPAEDLPDWEA
jgi:hypothetical protein